MSKAVLTAAKELIDSGKYHEAATILRTLPDDPTAQKWLANLEAKYLPKAAPTEPTSIGLTAKEMKAYEAKRLREAKAGKRPNRLRGCLVLLLLLGVLYVVSQNGRNSSVSRSTAVPRATEPRAAGPAPTVTASATITETPVPATARPTDGPVALEATRLAESQGQILLTVDGIVIGEATRVLINPNTEVPVVVVEWEIAQGFDGPQIDLTGYEMVQVACALFELGYAEDWRYQLSAMVELVNTSNGQTFTDDGITARVDGADVAGWDCSNAINIRIENAATDYFVNPVLNR